MCHTEKTLAAAWLEVLSRIVRKALSLAVRCLVIVRCRKSGSAARDPRLTLRSGVTHPSLITPADVVWGSVNGTN